MCLLRISTFHPYRTYVLPTLGIRIFISVFMVVVNTSRKSGLKFFYKLISGYVRNTYSDTVFSTLFLATSPQFQTPTTLKHLRFGADRWDIFKCEEYSQLDS